MPKLGQNIYKRKDGRWEGRFIKGRYAGKTQYGYVYAQTYNDVKERLAASEKRYAKRACMPEDATFQEFSARWLCSVGLKVKESTYARYVFLLSRHLLPYFQDFSITEINRYEIDEFTNLKLNSGRVDGNGGLSSKTVRDLLSILKAVIEYSRSFININNVIITYPKNSAHEMNVLSIQEQTRLESVLIGEKSNISLGVLICLYTGIRIGELCALSWSDISFYESSLSINKTIQRIYDSKEGIKKSRIHIGPPKSRASARKIPIPKFILNILDEIKTDNDNDNFLSGSPDRFIEPRVLQYRFRHYLEKGDIHMINFHSLRHTFATRCIELGFDAKSLSEILGHSSVNITLNRYVHSSYEQKKRNMDKLLPISGAAGLNI